MRFLSGIASAMVVAGLSLSSTVAQAGKSDDTLHVAFPKQLPTLDGYYDSGREGIIFSRHVWDGLLYRDLETGEYKGNLATSYKWVDDITIEFELRQGVQFHNGEKFDADDVVYTLNRVSDPESGVKNRRFVSWIKNVEKTGEYSVRLHLNDPFPAALEYLSGPLAIYPDEYYSKVGPDGMGTAPIGTGPYKVTSVEPAKRYVLEKYDGYHNSPKGKPSIGKIVWRGIPEKNTQYAELMSGNTDWIWQVPSDQAEKMKSRFTVTSAPSMRIGYLTFDASKRAGESPVNDVRVRQAIAHGINRQGIVDALLKGSAQVVHSACFPSQFGCAQDVPKYDYDLKKAKALLAEAGYPDGFSMPIYAYRNRDYAEAMLGDLQNMGIKADLRMLKYPAIRELIQGGKMPLAFMTWGSYSVNDISAITSLFFKNSKDDYARDPEVNKWLQEGDTSIDPAVRKASYQKALSRIASEVYWLPLWSYTTNYVHTDQLEFKAYPDEVARFFLAKWK